MPSETREGWWVESNDNRGVRLAGNPCGEDLKQTLADANKFARILSGEYPETEYRAVRVRITAEWEG